MEEVKVEIKIIINLARKATPKIEAIKEIIVLKCLIYYFRYYIVSSNVLEELSLLAKQITVASKTKL